MSQPAGADAASDPWPEVPIRPAATVMLVRDAPAGLEVFVLRRVAAMAFAPGMTVFPGGAVDPADHDPALDWSGPDIAWWAEHLQQEAGLAKALVVAAVRELFEETGVLLAGPGESAGPAVVPSLDDAVRLALIDHRITLASALAQAGLRLRADLLRPWANWITPPGRTKRYDTFFFAAALPPGQLAEMLTTEAVLGPWRTPQELFAER
ncbi:MAG: NUDIX hydrolase, partial [Nakamurella sp.]